MLAERFLPGLFDQIAGAAASSADGRCPDLAGLEALSPQVKDDSMPESVLTPETGKPSVKATNRLREWVSSAAFRSWAQVHPLVGDEDLRPYLFVAKEQEGLLWCCYGTWPSCERC